MSGLRSEREVVHRYARRAMSSSNRYYTGHYMPGPNDHGDTDGAVMFADAHELALLMHTTEENLSWIDHGAGRMIMRTDMQRDDAAPVNRGACTLLNVATRLAELGALPTIRGPVVNFQVNEAPPISLKGNT
jgi:hypothetical protein